MRITNNRGSVVYDFGPKKYTGNKGFTSVRLVQDVFYIVSSESNNTFSIKFRYGEVEIPASTSALSLYKQLTEWLTETSGSGTSSVSAEAPLEVSNGVISLNEASLTEDGYLSKEDYSRFSSKSGEPSSLKVLKYTWLLG